MAFAEHRKWPNNPYVRQKCLLYAGMLAHYAADVTQPLHTTIHHDGRARADGSSPRTGIHAKVDALLGKLTVKVEDVAGGLDVKAIEAAGLLPAILEELKASHALVERVYAMEKDLPGVEDPLPADSEAAKFALERLGEASRFTASLYLTAWRNSAKVRMPSWPRRGEEKAAPGGAAASPASQPAGGVNP
jgi:hypothetical protein